MSKKNAAQATVKTVADPCAAYESMTEVWNRNRAVCSGERSVKDYDGAIDAKRFANLLIPFSPTMTPAQYAFYRAEAELPGICAQYSRMLVGGLLRKKPQLTLPDGAPADAVDWILNEFGQDGSSLTAFLDRCLWEEIQTSRAWVYVDHPVVAPDKELSLEERAALKPYPVLWAADFVINWRVHQDDTGREILNRVITAGFEETYDENEFHPTLVQTVWVHELDESGFYQIRKFQRQSPSTNVGVSQGRREDQADLDKAVFICTDVNDNILVNGERLTFIPAWPLNGSVDVVPPIISAIVDKEVSLYNKISRRNHLLYGAATYTPVLMSNMGDDDFDDIVGKGLGSWLRIGPEDKIDVLRTPTEALADMEKTIASGIEEMAKLGIRMLSPESAQSGVALQLRNAAQTAQLGTLNNKVSATMSQVIAFMLNWRYDAEYSVADVNFSLSADFNPTPLGADWLRLATEWYQAALIPRSIWLEILKHNDMIAPEYDDEKGRQEIVADLDLTMGPNNAKDKQDFADELNKEK